MTTRFINNHLVHHKSSLTETKNQLILRISRHKLLNNTIIFYFINEHRKRKRCLSYSRRDKSLTCMKTWINIDFKIYIQNIHNLSIKSISDCKKMSGKKRKTNISVKNKQGKLNKYEK